MPTADPRLTADTPFLNVRPEVRYVGDEACAGCHSKHSASYRQHPMGRSLAPIAQVANRQRYEEAVHNPFDADGFQYRIEREGDRVFHRETCKDSQGQVIADQRVEIHHAIGSGTHAYSYLIEREGYVFQSPITWYTQKGIWDLSPGYHGRHTSFERPVRAECLFCHTNRVEPTGDALNHYQQPIFHGHAIGCERCHGPGELHVARRERAELVAGLDETIVNPAHLSQPLRESICQQCHLQGAVRVVRRGLDVDSFRPGLPLHLFWSVFVRPPEFADTLLVSHVEQMHESRCFRDSREPKKLGCISCHDPHSVPASEKKVEFYRDRCLKCHEDQSCKLPPATRRATVRDDSCIVCHMPKLDTADITHTAITDHRVVRQPQGKAAVPPSRTLRPGEVPLTHFHANLVQSNDPEVARDLGLALVELARERSAVSGQLAETALGYLDPAVRRGPKDVAAWEARGQALLIRGQPRDALDNFERVLALAPSREVTLADAARCAERLDDRAAAIAYWERMRAVVPSAATPHFEIARLRSLGNEWEQAAAESQEALRINPAHINARLLLVGYYLQRGDKTRARTEFDAVLALHPADPEAMRRWFAEKSK